MLCVVAERASLHEKKLFDCQTPYVVLEINNYTAQQGTISTDLALGLATDAESAV